MNYLFAYLLNWLQSKCTHPDYTVKADILDGGYHCQVQWCEMCGAFRKTHFEAAQVGGKRIKPPDTEWRRPQPLYSFDD